MALKCPNNTITRVKLCTDCAIMASWKKLMHDAQMMRGVRWRREVPVLEIDAAPLSVVAQWTDVIIPKIQHKTKRSSYPSISRNLLHSQT